MLVTVSEDRTMVTVKSDVLSDFAAINTVTLKVKLNCTLVETITIEEGDIVNTDEYIVLATAISRTVFEQGLWGFELDVLNDDDTLVPEFRCTLIDTDLTCKVAAYSNSTATETQRSLLLGDYVILQNSHVCASDCVDYCTIYERLTDELLESSCS